MFSLILPNIRSCHNVGAMFRTADATGVDKLYLCGYTATPPKPQIDKVSLGAEQWMPWEHKKEIVSLLNELKKNGTYLIALEQTNQSTPITEITLPDKDIALIVGNEVDGVGPDVLELCDAHIEIPMYGKKKSLNVSIAAGIAMYELRTKIGSPSV